MPASPLLRAILDDDSLSRHLGDAEGRLLFEWLYERAEMLTSANGDDPGVASRIQRLQRRVRAIGRFVHLWCDRRDRGAAGQLAAAEQFHWPMPTPKVDSCVLIETILRHEDRIAA